MASRLNAVSRRFPIARKRRGPDADRDAHLFGARTLIPVNPLRDAPKARGVLSGSPRNLLDHARMGRARGGAAFVNRDAAPPSLPNARPCRSIKLMPQEVV